MQTNLLFHPPLNEGINAALAQVHVDQSFEEIKDEARLRALTAPVDDIDATNDMAKNFRRMARLYTSWYHRPAPVDIFELAHAVPYTKLPSGEELLGISNEEYQTAYQKAGAGPDDVEDKAGQTVTVDIRPIQIAFFTRIKREDLIHR